MSQVFDMKTDYLVDRILPEDMLLIQGKYVQTWAHIERNLFFICMLINGVKFETSADINENLPARKNTSELRRKLDEAISSSNGAQKRDLETLVEAFDVEWQTRHFAIHGAWVPNREGPGFKCEYFDNQGERRNPNWRVYAAAISRDEIRAAMDRANQLLVKADELSEGLKRERSARKAERGADQ